MNACLYKTVLVYTNMLVEYVYIIYIVWIWYVTVCMSMNTACDTLPPIRFTFQTSVFRCYSVCEVWDGYISVNLLDI